MASIPSPIPSPIPPSKEGLIVAFRKIAILYDQINDTYRGKTFSRVAGILENKSGPIPDLSNLREIKGIGSSTIACIEEYQRTGRIERLEQLMAANPERINGSPLSENTIEIDGEVSQTIDRLVSGNNPEKRAKGHNSSRSPSPNSERVVSRVDNVKMGIIELFMSIHGVGKVTANKWWDKGWRTLDDVKENEQHLTKAQKISLKYREYLEKRIPRDEIESFETRLKQLLSSYEFLICGSYRRQCPDSGDVDLLIMSKADSPLSKVMEILASNNIILDDLAKGGNKYMGVARLTCEGIPRRLDIRMIDEKSWAFATLYFTGNVKLNVEMRERAIARGLRLSEYGLYDKEGRTIHCNSESEIFELLGMEYLEPPVRSI